MCSLSSVSSPASCGGRRLLRHKGAVRMRHGTTQDRVRSCSRGTGAQPRGLSRSAFPRAAHVAGRGAAFLPGGRRRRGLPNGRHGRPRRAPASPRLALFLSRPAAPFHLMALTGLPPAAALALCLCRALGSHGAPRVACGAGDSPRVLGAPRPCAAASPPESLADVSSAPRRTEAVIPRWWRSPGACSTSSARCPAYS